MSDGRTLGPDPLVGRLLEERYRLTRRLGTGRLGAVYRADDVQSGQAVAVKVLHRPLAEDETFRKAFARQRPWGAPLPNNHQRLIAPRAFGQTDGELYVVIELVEGRPLADLLARERPLPVERALRLAVQIGEGLEAAHAMGLVHQSLSPRSVVLEGADENVRLFGFALARCRDVPVMRQLVRNGPAEYLAPEQVSGGEASEASDLYAFGAILYEMLCGGPPFSGSTRDAVLARQVKDAPVAPRKLRRSIPPAIERLVLALLAKKPSDRPRDISVAVNELWKEEGRLHDVGDQRGSVLGQLGRRLGEPRARAVAAVVAVAVAVPLAWAAWSQRTALVSAVSRDETTAPPVSGIAAPALVPPGSDTPPSASAPPAQEPAATTSERPAPPVEMPAPGTAAPRPVAAVPSGAPSASSAGAVAAPVMPPRTTAPAPPPTAPVPPAATPPPAPAAVAAPVSPGVPPAPPVPDRRATDEPGPAPESRPAPRPPAVRPATGPGFAAQTATPRPETPPRVTPPPAPAAPAAPRAPAAPPPAARDEEGIDPAGIIDWLLKDRPRG
jgi:serine/threonine-protein kinase